ncbi:uncharacterized protein BDZ99DRAFT_60335 [Mytilinidion resinicola]|uniref:Uncharacterized protein n=1 Tax=Mytilinidion resinicola TaxID=574789 RepID=A0A6A6YII1_9PEZI|nr:uncharacterized protein BDZ99DRAFT_60335 [Mytilinidion resinicola]KAF2808656.1 hypothetical protein BDZ99DRAFT_60335 [Mytilinidion resinicola]
MARGLIPFRGIKPPARCARRLFQGKSSSFGREGNEEVKKWKYKMSCWFLKSDSETDDGVGVDEQRRPTGQRVEEVFKGHHRRCHGTWRRWRRWSEFDQHNSSCSNHGLWAQERTARPQTHGEGACSSSTDDDALHLLYPNNVITDSSQRRHVSVYKPSVSNFSETMPRGWS